MQMTSVREEKENDTGNNYRSCGKRSVQHNKRFGEEEKKMSKSFDEWYKDQKEFQKEWAEQELGIVRCKDCKQWDAELGCCTSYTIVKCTDGREGVSSDADDFCSRGERK